MYTIRKLRQKPGHCGPATIEMMYSIYGIHKTQDEIAQAIGDVERITERGCSVDEMAHAVEQLTPNYILLGKMYGTIEDLRVLTEKYLLPVGVEWRGRFLEPDGRIWEEGHYSLVTHVNLSEGSLEVIDPYAPGVNLLSMNDLIPIDLFLQRWWDTNPIPSPENPAVVTEIRDDRLLYVLVPKTLTNGLRAVGLSPMMAVYSR
ncbi:MAG TPA: hypothetical protein VK003_10020 [Oceanobacillus sp.]|nr:hypothetical protein [Oceanobacillus sp.]